MQRGGGQRIEGEFRWRIFNERHGRREDGMFRTLKTSSDETLNIPTPSAETVNWLLMAGKDGKVGERGGNNGGEEDIQGWNKGVSADKSLNGCIPSGGRRTRVGGREKSDRRVNAIIWRLILQNYAVPIYSVQSANAELLQWVILSSWSPHSDKKEQTQFNEHRDGVFQGSMRPPTTCAFDQRDENNESSFESVSACEPPSLFLFRQFASLRIAPATRTHIFVDD